jgi:hypothetical protein
MSLVPLRFAFIGRGRFALCGCAFVVFFEEPVEDFYAGGRTDGPALHVPVGVEAVIEWDVSPAVGVYHGFIEFDMNRPEACDISVGFICYIWIVDKVV